MKLHLVGKFACISCALLLMTSHVFAVGDDAPAWLRQAAQTSAPVYDKETPAVVLHDEDHVTITADGRVTTTTRFAVRILNRNGRNAARADEYYVTDGSKIRDMRAWLLRPSGQVKNYGKDETLDLASSNEGGIYSESRVKAISATSEADAGAVFGYESTREEKFFYTQSDWRFQGRAAFDGRLPSLLSRYTLTLPAGWRAESVTFNHTAVTPTVSGTTYTWEMRNLPPIEPEPASPEVSALAPRLAVTYFPAQNQQLAGGTFSSWTDVSRWMTDFTDAAGTPNDRIAAEATRLTQNAKTEFERIAAIARYVQDIQYVSISLNLGRGGGWRPRTAAEVFDKRWGDCKDKANLMRAMLKSVGITSYLMPIYAGDAEYVRAEWASPQQFNHCIIAVRVAAETKAGTVIEHPTLGRLLIFDPTDDNTLVGDLPDHEQNSLALLLAGADGKLLRMPTTQPEQNNQERTTNVELAADGSITAQVNERSAGQAAASERGMMRGLNRPEYSKAIEGWIANNVTGAQIRKIEPVDDQLGNKFALDVAFTAASYAQLMNNRLLVFKPTLVARRNSLALTNVKRKHPVMLKAQAYNETVRFKLPAGFDVDETPEPTKIETGFGSYATTYETKDGHLVFTRRLMIRNATVPVGEYAAVRNFFECILAAEQAPVVLAKQ